MRVVFGLLGFVLIALGVAVALDVRAIGRSYVAMIDRTTNHPRSLAPRGFRRFAARRPAQLRWLAACGLIVVGIAWVLVATFA